MLHGQYRGGHEHRDLLAIACGPEGGPNGNLCFAESHVAAHKPIHRGRLLHVGANGGGGFVLVGRVFVHEARFQRMLQIPVFGVGVTRRRLPFGVQLQQVVGNLLDSALGFLLRLRPGVGAELVDFRLGAFLAAVLGNAMQAVNADVEDVASAVRQPDGFLHFAIDLHLVQAAKLPDAVVDVHHKITHFQRHQFLDGERLFVLPEPFLQSEAMVTLKHLVVGVHKNLQVLVHKALAQLDGDGLVGHGFLTVFELVVKDVVDAFQLRGLPTHHHVDVSLFVVGPQVARNHVKLLVEGWLGGHSVLEDDACRPCGASTEFDHSERF